MSPNLERRRNHSLSHLLFLQKIPLSVAKILVLVQGLMVFLKMDVL
jgi:hypothetical protein